LPIAPHHADRVATLPLHHRDPFDRLLVAQADSDGHALVTADRHIARYGIEIVW
jgi:PIN domain nuclease of toxin-antitoxin system